MNLVEWEVSISILATDAKIDTSKQKKPKLKVLVYDFSSFFVITALKDRESHSSSSRQFRL